LLFQPAEENGSGAAAVIADRRYADIRPDYAFALHNMPGVALGRVELCKGAVNCASRGLRIVLTGKTAHASEPDKGLSPMAAMAKLMPGLAALGAGTDHRRDDFRLVTVTHAQLGEPAFGIAPGAGEVWATLRCLRDDQMAALCAEAEALVMRMAQEMGLEVACSYHDVFLHCENHPEAVQILQAALDAQGIVHDRGNLPMRASEDFGRFGATAKSAMFMLGAGRDHASLHNPDYDFPDDLIAIGAGVFLQVVADLLGD
jgi:amidohydrolase